MPLDPLLAPPPTALPWAAPLSLDGDGVTTKLILTEGAFERLLPEWWGLWQRSDASPFGSPAWLFSWWRTYAPGDLFAIAVRRHGALVGLAPLYRDLDHGRTILRFIGTGSGGEFDLVLDRHERAAALAAIARSLVEYADLWDAVALDDVAPDAHALRLSLDGFDRRGGQRPPAMSVVTTNAPSASTETGLVGDTDETVVPLLERLLAYDETIDERGAAFLRRATPALRVAGLLHLAGTQEDGRIVGVRYGLSRLGRTHLLHLATGASDNARSRSRLVEDARAQAAADGSPMLHLAPGILAQAVPAQVGGPEDAIRRPLARMVITPRA